MTVDDGDIDARDEDCRHVRGRRKDGGRGTATRTVVFGGIVCPRLCR